MTRTYPARSRHQTGNWSLSLDSRFTFEGGTAVSICRPGDFATRLCAGINSGISMHQDSDGDAPSVFIQFLHAHHIPDLLAVNRIVGPEIQRHNDIHSDEIMIRGSHKIQSGP